MERYRRLPLGWMKRPLFSVTTRGLLIAVLLLALLAGGLYVVRRPLLRTLADWLVVDHPARQTDVIFLLGGDVTTKVDHAAAIYSAVKPRLILISPFVRAQSNFRRLVNLHKIPAEKILILPSDRTARSTYDEARFLAPYVRRRNIRSITIVTEAPHTGRAHWIFRRLLPADMEIRMSAAAPEGFSLDTWWREEDGMVTVMNECLKWGYYWWKY